MAAANTAQIIHVRVLFRQRAVSSWALKGGFLAVIRPASSQRVRKKSTSNKRLFLRGLFCWSKSVWGAVVPSLGSRRLLLIFFFLGELSFTIL